MCKADNTLNKDLKNLIEDRVWNQVASKAESDDVLYNNHIVVEWGGLVYDIYYKAYVGTTWDNELSWVELQDVECFVSSKHGEDDDEECLRLADIVCDHLEFRELKN